MKVKGIYNELHPGITMHKIPVQAGFPGAVFTIGMLAVFVMGIPLFIYFLVFAIVPGIGVAVMLRFIPRQAGVVLLVFTGVMIVCLAGMPSMDWQEEKLDTNLLMAATVAPPPEFIAPFRCDCHQRRSKQPCARTTQRDRSQERPQPASPFNGTWKGKVNDLPGVSLIVADAGGGEPGGIVAFYFQVREMMESGGLLANSALHLLAAQAEGKMLTFEVQHHKAHGSPEFGPDVKFCTELTAGNEALLYNVSEPSAEPVKLTRQAYQCKNCF